MLVHSKYVRHMVIYGKFASCKFTINHFVGGISMSKKMSPVGMALIAISFLTVGLSTNQLILLLLAVLMAACSAIVFAKERKNR